jgi:hypothetical protein
VFYSIIKLRGKTQKHSKTGGFYASKIEYTADGTVQNTP